MPTLEQQVFAGNQEGMTIISIFVWASRVSECLHNLVGLSPDTKQEQLDRSLIYSWNFYDHPYYIKSSAQYSYSRTH